MVQNMKFLSARPSPFPTLGSQYSPQDPIFKYIILQGVYSPFHYKDEYLPKAISCKSIAALSN